MPKPSAVRMLFDAPHDEELARGLRTIEDSIAEFLTFSVSSEDDPAEPARPALNGAFALQCSDADAAWTIRDAGLPGTIRHDPGAETGIPTITATASDLILWLYRRIDLETGPVPPDLLARFQALCFTD